MPEPGVQQVQHGVLDAADVQVDAAGRRPARMGPSSTARRRGRRTLSLVRIEVAQLVPARTGPLRHHVGLAAVPPRAVAEIELDVQPLVGPREQGHGNGRLVVGREGSASSRRPRAARPAASVRQPHRQTGLVVDDGERLAPVALPGEQPVAQPVLMVPSPYPSVASHSMMTRLGRPRRPARRGRLSLALLMAGPSPVKALPSKPSAALHRADDRQAVRLGEVPVPLVLAGHRHDRAGAVPHQHVVGDEHRDRAPLTGLIA